MEEGSIFGISPFDGAIRRTRIRASFSVGNKERKRAEQIGIGIGLTVVKNSGKERKTVH
jgi:hypothetical protein